jgi:hypothetical protein
MMSEGLTEELDSGFAYESIGGYSGDANEADGGGSIGKKMLYDHHYVAFNYLHAHDHTVTSCSFRM